MVNMELGANMAAREKKPNTGEQFAFWAEGGRLNMCDILMTCWCGCKY